MAAKHGLSLEAVEQRAHTTLDRIAGTITLSCVRFMAWFLKKLWRRLYTALHIDERGLQRVCLPIPLSLILSLFLPTTPLPLTIATRYVKQSRNHQSC